LVGGRIVNALDSNPYSTASQDLISYLYEYYNEPKARFFCSNNMAMNRRAFLDIGGFDPLFASAGGEDREFCDRWHHQGRPMLYAAHAVVNHAHNLDRGSFWRQHLRYGRAAVHYKRIYAARRGRTVAVEPLRFYAKLILHPFSEMTAAKAFRCSVLLFLSQVANTAGFIAEARRLGTADR
jgi:GT2 family glycosyltransferase